MKKYLFILVFILLLTPVFFASAAEVINLYFFYGDGCPHCTKEEVFLDKLELEYENIKIHRYEVWRNRENADLLKNIAQKLNLNVRGVPVLIVGEETVAGYYNDQVTGERIKEIINDYTINGCEDPLANILGKQSTLPSCLHECEHENGECVHDCGCSVDNIIGDKFPDTINLPFIGEVNAKNVSLPFLTFLIAATDGFNPCAMWVLLFLISLLLGMEDKRRMWVLGSAFILASGIVYFLFLSAWLNLFLFLGFVFWIRIIIGLVALGSGGFHLRTAWKNRDGGCEVVNTDKRKRIFEKLRELATEKKFWVALLGIVALAFAVNLVELVCSAGLPAVYTQVLALANLPLWQYYGYLLFYILIFMLDDLLVFVIAMTTLRMKALSSRYTKWSGWVGGIIMILIGLLLLFKPGWIMFG